MKKFFALIALGLLTISCIKTEIIQSSSEMGALTVDMTLGTQTRADSQTELLENAMVHIYMADFSGLVRSYLYKNLPEAIYLKADKYRVDVIAGEAVKANPENASWTNKSYRGFQEFEIKPYQNVNVTVQAKINNAVTAIEFDPTIASNFADGYTFTIGLTGTGKNLVYTADKSAKDGYFLVDGIVGPEFTWTFSGVLKKDGKPLTMSGTIENIEPGKRYSMTLKYTIRGGELGFTLSVDTDTDIIDDTIIFEPLSTGLVSSKSYEIWAGHATVRAEIDETDPAYADKEVKFSYSKTPSDESSWKDVAGEKQEDGTWSAKLTKLDPSTEYTYRLLIGDVEVGDRKTFTTEDTKQITNGSFEEYYHNGKYYDYYNPSSSIAECRTAFWDSGNAALTTLGSSVEYISLLVDDVPRPADDPERYGSKSVTAASRYVVVKFAAGNLFTGSFYQVEGTKGGTVDFGRPWEGYRPTALKVWCKYTTGTFGSYLDDKIATREGLSSNSFDRAQIRVALGVWENVPGGKPESPVRVNTTDESTFIDFNTDANTIANGELIIYNDGYKVNKDAKVSADVSGWLQYTIPLDYESHSKRNQKPTHVIISCASSMFGDYFSGSTSSRLGIDGVEFVYE